MIKKQKINDSGCPSYQYSFLLFPVWRLLFQNKGAFIFIQVTQFLFAKLCKYTIRGRTP